VISSGAKERHEGMERMYVSSWNEVQFAEEILECLFSFVRLDVHGMIYILSMCFD